MAHTTFRYRQDEAMNGPPFTLHKLAMTRSRSNPLSLSIATIPESGAIGMEFAPAASVLDKVTSDIRSALSTSEYGSSIALAISSGAEGTAKRGPALYVDTGSPTDSPPSPHEHKAGCGVERCEGECKAIEGKMDIAFGSIAKLT